MATDKQIAANRRNSAWSTGCSAIVYYAYASRPYASFLQGTAASCLPGTGARRHDLGVPCARVVRGARAASVRVLEVAPSKLATVTSNFAHLSLSIEQ